MIDAEGLAQGAVEALLEDEALRGDLTDDGFAPLLEWATGALSVAATGAAAAGDEAAARARMDASARAIKDIVTTVASAAADGGRDGVMRLLREPLLKADLATRLRVAAVGLRLGDDPDANAAMLARALRGLRPS